MAVAYIEPCQPRYKKTEPTPFPRAITEEGFVQKSHNTKFTNEQKEKKITKLITKSENLPPTYVWHARVDFFSHKGFR